MNDPQGTVDDVDAVVWEHEIIITPPLPPVLWYLLGLLTGLALVVFGAFVWAALWLVDHYAGG